MGENRNELLRVARRQAKVIIVQWVTILVLIAAIIVLAVNLSKVEAAALEPEVTVELIDEEVVAETAVMEAAIVPKAPAVRPLTGPRVVIPEAPLPTPEPTPAPTPEPTPEPCPITEDELVVLAKVMYREGGALSWRGTQFGVSYKARQAAIAWCAFNRLDDEAYPDTLIGVLTYPYAFAYIADTPVVDELFELARDVADRWWAEKQGAEDVGRTLPSNYFFFHGDGKENYFRDAYQAPYNTWDWSLPDPYSEARYDD